MHAAKPAAAIEQATMNPSSDRSGRTENVCLTSNLSLTSTFRSRYRTATLKQHPDRLNTH